MKSKNLLFFMFMIMMLSFSTFSQVLNYSNESDIEINDIGEDGIELVDEKKDITNVISSDATNDDRTDQIEKASQWLYDKLEDDELEEGGAMFYGQVGLTGVGQLFLEMNEISRARAVGDKLLEERQILDGKGFPSGKWPSRDDWEDTGVTYANYTGFEEGVAGIANFLLDLYEETNDNDYWEEVLNIHNYLESVRKNDTDDKASAWKVKDYAEFEDNPANPFRNISIKGNIETKISNLTLEDSEYLNISSELDGSDYLTNTDFFTSLSDLGAPQSDLYEGIAKESVKEINIKITAEANDTVNSADMQIYCPTNSSWVEIDKTQGLSTTGDTFYKTFTNDAKEYFNTEGNLQIKINSSEASTHKLMIDQIEITIDYDSERNSTNYYYGTAGIGEFYLNFYEYDTDNKTIFQTATAAANYSIRQGNEVNDMIAWKAEDERYYTGIQKGTAGIARFLLGLHNSIGDSETYYHEYVKKAVDWLINNSDTSNILGRNVSKWRQYNTSSSSNYFNGMEYTAGIGQLILDFANSYDPANQNYLNNASQVANWLTTKGSVVQTIRDYGEDLIYRWMTPSEVDFSYSTGGAGALYFLDNIRTSVSDNKYYEYLSGGIEWLANINITDSYWANDNTQYSIPDGLAGICHALNHISLLRPQILNQTTPPKVDYSLNPHVVFDVTTYSSSLSAAKIKYSYGQNYEEDYWFEDILTFSGSSGIYYFSGYSQNTTIHYMIIAIDSRGAFSYDNNNTEGGYVLRIVDEIAPITNLTLGFSSLGINSNGTMLISIDKESVRGAQFDYVIVKIPVLGISDRIPDYFFELNGSIYRYNYTVFVDDSVSFNDTITIDVYTYDANDNRGIISKSFLISDNFVPRISDVKTPSQWIPQYVGAKVTARVTDIGSEIDDDEGVFIMFTSDGGASWNTVYMTKTSGENDTYEGTIPGQILLSNIYFIIGASDENNNTVYVDKWGTTYSDYKDVKIVNAYSYTVMINLTVILIVVGIIAGCTTGGYLIYVKRGDYLSRMRRKSKSAATGLVIRERMTNAYYWIYDKLVVLGQKIGGLSENMYDFRMWFEDHTGETTTNILRGIGRFLYGIPKGIVNGIANFFRGVGRIITETKPWKIFIAMVLGLMMLLTNVIHFIMEGGGYPLRAVLFSNLGFIILISSLVLFLTRFIYQLVYK